MASQIESAGGAKVKKPRKEKGKGKGKENVENSKKTRTKVSKKSSATATTVDAGVQNEDMPWTTLFDASVSSRPAVFTADGNYFFSVVGTSVRIYSVATGRIVSTLSSSSVGHSRSNVAKGEGHTDAITAAILNPLNPFQLLTASFDGDIKIWDFLDAVLLETIHVGMPISHMCAHEKFAEQVFISVLTRLRKNRSASDSLERGNSMVYRVSLKPKSSASSQKSRSSEIVRIGKTKAAVSMAVSPSGQWLVLIAGHKAYVSSTSAPEGGFTRFVSPEKLTCLAFHPNDDYFATGDEQGVIRIWYCLDGQLMSDAGSGEKRAQTTTMHWHAHAVSSIAFTTNGAYILSGGEESVLVIWQLHTGKKEFVPRLGSPIISITTRKAGIGEEEYLLDLADGSYVFVNAGSLSISRSVPRIKLDPKGISRPTHTPVPLAVHAPSASLILPASHPSSLQIYAPASATLLAELEVSPSNRISRRDEKPIESSRVEFASVSASGQWMATLDRRENDDDFNSEVYLKFWHWESSKWVLNTRIDRPHGSKAVASMNFSPSLIASDDDLLMTAGLDGNIKVWSRCSYTNKGGQVEEYWMSRSSFSFRSEIPMSAKWSPDGSLVAICFSRQAALYNPHSNVLLDTLLSVDVKRLVQLGFMGRSGRYLVVAGKHNAALWDLVTRSVCWEYHSPLEIAQVVTHPEESLAAFIMQPYAEQDAIRTSKILLFQPSSPKPFESRSLPFRFRAVDWYRAKGLSRALIGITYAWNIVLCGDDARSPAVVEEASRQIDLNANVAPKRTLFQDIFGKSAFVDPSSSSIPRPPIASSYLTSNVNTSALSVFDAPSYLAPPIDSLYSSLMDSFLSRVPQNDDSRGEDENMKDDVEDTPEETKASPAISQIRIVDDEEISSLISLFQAHAIDNTTKAASKLNGIANGARNPSSGMRTSTPKSSAGSHSLVSANDAPHDIVNSVAAPSQASSPAAIGKKRKAAS